MSIADILDRLEFPPAPPPKGLYKPVIVSGNIVYISGHAPYRADGSRITGKLGAELDLTAGKTAARQAGLAVLSTLRKEFEMLDRLRLVKTAGLVNCTPDFTQLAPVIDGCSELFCEVFGPDRGVGARLTAGAVSLPGGIAVEIEAIFEMTC
jgi:enamine deaminase RidA (YjgF/YER057c/UK114 family)